MGKKSISKLLIKIIKTLGVCAGAYILLSLLGNYGKKSNVVNKAKYVNEFKDRESDKIIEAKIETWR